MASSQSKQLIIPFYLISGEKKYDLYHLDGYQMKGAELKSDHYNSFLYSELKEYRLEKSKSGPKRPSIGKREYPSDCLRARIVNLELIISCGQEFLQNFPNDREGSYDLTDAILKHQELALLLLSVKSELKECENSLAKRHKKLEKSRNSH